MAKDKQPNGEKKERKPRAPRDPNAPKRVVNRDPLLVAAGQMVKGRKLLVKLQERLVEVNNEKAELEKDIAVEQSKVDELAAKLGFKVPE